MRIEVTKTAIQDYREVKEYYEDKIPSVVLEQILLEIEICIEELATFPLAGRVVEGNLRRKTVSQYNYTILYKIIGEILYVMRVLDTRRKPVYKFK